MYERHGFLHIPQRLGDSGHTATTIFMVKDLHPIKIVQYQPEYKQDFIRLNREWIERYFRIEPSDEKTFAHTGDIINGGGQIFLAIDEEMKLLGAVHSSVILRNNAMNWPRWPLVPRHKAGASAGCWVNRL